MEKTTPYTLDSYSFSCREIPNFPLNLSNCLMLACIFNRLQ